MNYSSQNCYHILDALEHYLPLSHGKKLIISTDDASQLYFACAKEREAEYSDRISRPMVWIGIYIAVASLLCIIAMTADLLHGFRNRRFWFPCRYFSLNAASMTVIAVTMKLPVDLFGPMQLGICQLTKVGSLFFLCVMMTNLMPSLASMDNKTLLANVAGLSILIITVTVNICIQIHTGAIFWEVAILIGMVLLLLVIIISSSLTIPTSKEILEFKYQARNKIFMADQHLQNIQMSTVEKLRQHVTRYWVMAESGSPQFVMTSNPLSIASGIICVVVMVRNSILLIDVMINYGYYIRSVGASPYKWSIVVIYLTQSIGVIVGTIAPLSRCFIIFNFKLTTKWNMNYFMFFSVERYWTQKLNEWKQSNICFLSRNRRARRLICNSKAVVLCFGIGLQKVTVVSCKGICVLVTIFPIIASSYWKSLNARLFTPHITSGSDDVDEDLASYVLQIDNETALSETKLKRIASSVKSFISEAEKEQNNNLLKFLEKSTGFEGVLIFDTDHVRSFKSYEVVNSWSLPIVTLTCIAMALQISLMM